MDYKEEQESELEALSEIYSGEITGKSSIQLYLVK